jgi:D-glycero-D-manno-heptose 1,7-bisphosphate phosphatase
VTEHAPGRAVVGIADRPPLSYTDAALSGGAADAARAAFLDRDGVINAGVSDPDSGLLESPLAPTDVHLLPGAAQAMRRLAESGYLLVCVSNQPAGAKAKATIDALLAVHARVLELLGAEGVRLAAWRLCVHHPDGVVPELSGPCACRKPAPGMLMDAAQVLGLDLGSCWMFGDTDADVRAGQAAGCRTVLIRYPGSVHKRTGAAQPSLVAADLADAVAQLLDRRSG